MVGVLSITQLLGLSPPEDIDECLIDNGGCLESFIYAKSVFVYIHIACME